STLPSKHSILRTRGRMTQHTMILMMRVMGLRRTTRHQKLWDITFISWHISCHNITENWPTCCGLEEVTFLVTRPWNTTTTTLHRL
ncbi:unnamed protein product, partial [Candidula unifasciata]